MLIKLKYPKNIDSNELSKCRVRDKKIQLASARLLEKVKVNKKSLVCDLGANRGNFSVVASTFAHTVYSYEPNPYAFEVLKLNVSAGNIRIYNAAVSLKNEKIIDLFIKKENNPSYNYYKSESSSIYEHKSNLENAQKLSVSNVFVGDLINSYQFDLIKMDIEGAEVELIPFLIENYSHNFGFIFAEDHTNKLPKSYASLLNKFRNHSQIIWGDL